MTNGYVSLILTGHVPYLRAAGREPEGEDLLHETICAALVPTLNVLCDLHERGLRPAVALAYSPVLLEQLHDAVVQKHFVVWMERRLARLEQQASAWEREGEPHRCYLARFYLDWNQGILNSFIERYRRNLVTALRELCADGSAEPLASAATHTYLPLVGRAEALRAQLDVGALSSTSLLGEKPRGYWLPECGYAPALEPMLQQSGAQYLVVDPASLNSATIPHLRPRWMPSRRLTVLVRDVGAGAQVIAPDVGYTGDPLYRSAQRDQRSDLALWRNDQDGSDGGLYDPYHAFRRAHEHALHFSSYLAAELSAFNARHDRPGLAVVPLDIDTLGRGWFEGPAWLRGLLEALNEHAPATLTTPSAYLQTFRPRQAATLHDGSWGAGGDHRAWSGRATVPLYQALDEVEERLALLIQREPHAVGDRERLLNQAVRELLLAQSSDWPLQLSVAESDTAARPVRDQALRRPTEHLRRCERLCDLAELPALSDQDSSYLDLVEELDNPFPQLNYRVFAA